jgi:hypothetical protein
MTTEELARAFAVRTQGRWKDTDAESLRARLTQRGRLGAGADFDAALVHARTWFFEADAHLFVCGGEPCRKRSRDVAGLEARLTQGSAAGAGLRVSITGCQGPCKQAPVGTLRVGERCQMFAQVHDICDWGSVLDYAGRAAAARTLLVDPRQAEAFRFDPVHHHDRASVPLQRLAFLVGHFAGEGHYPGRGGAFHKEVVGSWEAGGRFIGLRMAVTYPLDDGRNDVHEALVLVGYDGGSGTYTARAYTDSGTTSDYTLALDGDRLLFADRVPAHAAGATGARKVVAPRPGGYDEALEIRRTGEPFQTYSAIELRTAADRTHG